MAVININGKLAGAGLSSDTRFRQWGKLIAKPDHIDLKKANGYSLAGPFLTWGKSVAVAPGQFIV
jgi:hypothetical protein